MTTFEMVKKQINYRYTMQETYGIKLRHTNVEELLRVSVVGRPLNVRGFESISTVGDGQKLLPWREVGVSTISRNWNLICFSLLSSAAAAAVVII
jgi:hypothetical protein